MRAKIRAAAALAYERDLQAALEELQQNFLAWQDKKINAMELDEKIHEYHDGLARDLWKQYSMNIHQDSNVALALNRGLLAPGDLPSDVVTALESKRKALEGYDA